MDDRQQRTEMVVYDAAAVPLHWAKIEIPPLPEPSENMKLLEKAMAQNPDDETIWAAYQDACQEAGQMVPFPIAFERWQRHARDSILA